MSFPGEGAEMVGLLFYLIYLFILVKVTFIKVRGAFYKH